MLVLSRKKGEEIIIEGTGRTVIKVIRVNADGQVKLGLVAPREITINRAEVGLRTTFPAPLSRWPALALPKVAALAASPAAPG